MNGERSSHGFLMFLPFVFLTDTKLVLKKKKTAIGSIKNEYLDPQQGIQQSNAFYNKDIKIWNSSRDDI
jgi:hypothetical protein